MKASKYIFALLLIQSFVIAKDLKAAPLNIVPLEEKTESWTWEISTQTWSKNNN